MAEERKLPHALLNPASEPLYTRASRAILDALFYAYRNTGIKTPIFRDNPSYTALAGDAFSAFYVSWPIVRRRPVDDPVIETLRRVLHYLVQTPWFNRVQSRTRYSIAKSLVYSARLVLRVLQKLWDLDIVDYTGVDAKAASDERRLERAARDAAAKFKQDLQSEALQRLAAELEELQKLLEQQQSCKCRRQQHERQTVGGLAAGREPGSLEAVAKIAALAVANDDLMKIVILGGEIEAKFRFLRSSRRESRRGTVNGYTITANPAKALPREHALPDELWYAKLANGKWLAKRRVEEKLGMLVMALDKSGSMAGEKTVWSRSIAYALTKLAMKRRQPVALLFFDFVVHGPFTNPTEIIEMLLTVVSDGGTSIDAALKAALELLEEHRGKTNTIVLITDGEDTVKTRPEELKQHGARLVAVMIDGHNADLEKLAKASGGQYLKAELDERGALRVVDAAL